MSIQLDVETDERIALAGIESEVASALRELLHLDLTPAVVARDAGDGEWVIEVGDAALARVLAIEMPEAEGADEDYRMATMVSAGELRTPGSKALMIATAIALARRAGKAVVDDALLLTAQRTIEPSGLLERLRLAARQPSFEDGAARLADELDRGWRARRQR